MRRMHKIITIFGKDINLYLYANKLPLPIISIAICDDSFVGLMIISVAILGVEAGVQYIG